jgi:hypothetical protein
LLLVWQLQLAPPPPPPPQTPTCARAHTHTHSRTHAHTHTHTNITHQTFKSSHRNQSETPQHKETSMSVLSSLFDNMRTLMAPHLGAFMQILSANLSHSHAVVRRGALEALPHFFNATMQSHTLHFRPSKRS